MTPDQRHLAYGVRRYTNETNRLYGVMDRRLADRDYLAGDYSIADMAAWPWVLPELQGQDIDAFPHLKAWLKRVGERPAVVAGRQLGAELRSNLASSGKAAEEARKMLFGQRAR
jgi:GST-like protein